MAKIITTIKKIATLGKKELRYTEIDGEKKFDVRIWNGDKYDEGVRFSQAEINQLNAGLLIGKLPFDVGNKQCVIDGDNYCLSVLHNGRTYVRPICTKDEMEVLKGILRQTNCKLLDYDSNKVEKKTTTTVNKTEPAKEKKVTYKNAYEKFKTQFEEYREDQPENRRKGYELTHNIVIDHIKEIIKTSPEYNKNAMQEWKNSGNMMRYCQDKMFENAEKCMDATKEEAVEMLCQFVDEYIGDTSDKPKPKPKVEKPKAKTKKKG